MGTLLLILVPFAVLVTVTAAVLAVRELPRPAAGEARDGSWRPRVTTPPVWIGVTVVLLLLGLFVAPRLLGFTFLLLPFLWLRGPRQRRPGAPPEGRPHPDEDEDDPWADR